MYAKHPKLAKEFAEKTDFSSLPEKKRLKKIVNKLKRKI